MDRIEKINDSNVTRSLYEELLEERFAELPLQLQQVHDRRVSKRFTGRCKVERGNGWIARTISGLTQLPNSAADIPLSVHIEVQDGVETWTREFNGHRMRSRLWQDGRCLLERLGPMTFRFVVQAENERIDWRVQSVSALGVPLPTRWFAKTTASEQVREGRYVFEVCAMLPVFGLLIRYQGWLSEID